MKPRKSVCATCGAILSESATVCDLCGTPVSAPSDSNLAEPATSIPLNIPTQNKPIYCDQCGAENRPEAKFCYACGAPLSTPIADGLTPIPPTQPIPTLTTPLANDPKKRTLWLAGSAVLLIALLFGITMWSKSQKPKPDTAQMPAAQMPPAAATSAAPAPISAALEAKAKPLQEQLKSANGADKVRISKELAKIYVEGGRHDQAGKVMTDAAQTDKSADTWAAAGHHWYDWMDIQTDPQQRIDAAFQSITAYEKSLSIKDDPNVRTDLGAAYLTYSVTDAPRKDANISPMKAIQNTNMVLEKDPNHLQDNFNKGIMLMQIGRKDQAKVQFEKVKTLSKPNEPAYQRAEQALQELGLSGN